MVRAGGSIPSWGTTSGIMYVTVLPAVKDKGVAMYDIHVGDKFQNDSGKTVTVVEIDQDGSIKYEFESGARRWISREGFLDKFFREV